MSYLSPTYAREACTSKAGPDTKIIAGCMGSFPARITRDRTITLLDLSWVAEFRGNKRTFGSWRAGALATDVLTPSVPVTPSKLRNAIKDLKNGI